MIVLDFEAKQLKEKNKKLKLVPFMQIDGKTIAYKFGHKDCPFLTNNKCSIYSDRPCLCRAFPFIRTGFLTDKEVMISKICPEVNRLKSKEPTVYGNSYLSCLEFEMIIDEMKKGRKFSEKELFEKRETLSDAKAIR